LVDHVIDTLRRSIADGRWADALPGELQLCNDLHVSRTTLRKALEQLHREGVLTGAGNGRRHLIASPTGGRKDKASAPLEVAVLSSSEEHHMVSAGRIALDCLRLDLKAAGYGLQYIHMPRDMKERQTLRALKRVQARTDIAGWVLLGCSEIVQRSFAQSGLPVVIMGPVYPGINLPHVKFANHQVGMHAAGEFLRRKHRSVAFLQPQCWMLSDVEFVDGMRETLAASQCKVRLRVETHENSSNGIRRLVDRLLASPEPPTAFVISHPLYAFALVSSLMIRGLRIPEEVAIVSRMNDTLLALAVPKLSCYHYDGAKLGRGVVALLLPLMRKSRRRARSRELLPEQLRGETLGLAGDAA
jgi:LacI family transcriptional regulator